MIETYWKIESIKITTGKTSRSYSKGWSQSYGLVKKQLPGLLGDPFILVSEPCYRLHYNQSNTVAVEFSELVRT